MRLLPVLAALSILAAAAQAPARAAESYDSCTGFITSLPAYIDTQGTWCLNKDLATTMTTGEAILVNANNVTIDCNGFKVGGLGAGPESKTAGIATLSRNNTVIRDCNVRGFYIGIWADGGSGHVIEDNRLDGSLLSAIVAASTTGVIRRNQATDSGAAGGVVTSAIHVDGTVDVIDNSIDGVAPDGDNSYAVGIATDNYLRGVIAGNRVRGLVPTGAGLSIGIYNLDAGPLQMHGNHLFGSGQTNSIGIYCGDNQQLATQNQIVGFDYPQSFCTAFDNWATP